MIGIVKFVREALALVLPLTEAERDFLDRLLERGELAPELLTSDEHWARSVAQHPLLH